ncbi:MAG: hypothetical protein L6Q98_14340 [Anaerolineae bacterium]|nr:hypothetical protein [Anaerolineae bacterium]NUQ04807.1 hypothetical protein [Anaerolineae bacterium]
MNKSEPTHINLLHPRLTPRVQYVPPDPTTIEQFTRQACDALVSQGRHEFASRSLSWTIARLFRLVADLKSKQLNQKQKAI